MTPPNDSHRAQCWQALQRLADLNLNKNINTVDYSFDNPFILEDLSIDTTRQKINPEIKSALFQLAHACQLPEKIQALAQGDPVNWTENRPALHMMARQAKSFDLESDFFKMVTKIQSDPNIRSVISLGIGGSDLGPQLLTQVFPSIPHAPKIYFLANLDPHSLDLIKKLDPRQTIVIINSKTFTTFETLSNAKQLREWVEAVDSDLWAQNSYAVTAAPEKALSFGISPDHILSFDSGIGGRYSIWSGVSLSAVLNIGISVFQDFLKGAHAIDRHFLKYSENLELLPKNIPVWLGLLDVWNINFLNIPTLAVMPYLDRLELLPSYLQQLIMESNGKRVNRAGEIVNYQTAPIVWGGVGCQSQHAFMQLLHQSSKNLAATDFLISMDPEDRSAKLFASAISQANALWAGQLEGPAHRICPGGRSSNIFLFQKGFTPYQLGQLLALYEHRVFVQSVLWDINCFDQFGVELGKRLTVELLNSSKSSF